MLAFEDAEPAEVGEGALQLFYGGCARNVGLCGTGLAFLVETTHGWLREGREAKGVKAR